MGTDIVRFPFFFQLLHCRAYFEIVGRGNCHCLCASCERKGIGGYGPQREEGDLSDGGAGSEEEAEDGSKPEVNVNERRTRRGVYAVLQETDDDDTDDEDQDPEAAAIELDAETATPREATSIPSHSVAINGLMTPNHESSPFSSVPDAPSMSTANDQHSSTRSSAAFEPVISTRAQKARAASKMSAPPLITPPLSEETASVAESASRSGSRTRSTRASTLRNARSQSNSRPTTPAQPPLNGKGKGKAVAAPEVEHRTLRGRPPAPPPPAPPPAQKPKPKKVDPKKPLCHVCGKLCPIIMMGGKVIWGDFTAAGKKTKKIECPRCVTKRESNLPELFLIDACCYVIFFPIGVCAIPEFMVSTGLTEQQLKLGLLSRPPARILPPSPLHDTSHTRSCQR